MWWFYWDQRGAGKSNQKKWFDEGEMTLVRFLLNTQELTGYLKARFDQDKKNYKSFLISKPLQMPSNLTKLRVIKTTHTIVWAIFAGSILVIPLFAWLENWFVAGILILLVLLECIVLVFNQMSCPLTAVAARYTDDRADNFDIYLPLWLARHNKTIFGSLFVGVLIFSVIQWLS